MNKELPGLKLENAKFIVKIESLDKKLHNKYGFDKVKF